MFSACEPVPVSPVLETILREYLPLALAISSEKARSELIIAPVLVEVRRILGHKVSLFSGLEFNVDSELGLRGVCDFLFGLTPEQLAIETPVVAVVAAKNENIKQGIAQCIAAMVGAERFNQQRDRPIPVVYGVVTTGSNWKFLRMSGSVVTIDLTEYFIQDVGRLMGILVTMLQPQPPT